MMPRAAALLLLTALVLSGLAGCGRKDLPNYPPDADERPAQLPRRGTPVPYN